MKAINYMQNASEVATSNSEAIKSIYEVSLKAAQQCAELNAGLVQSFVDNMQKLGQTSDADARMKTQAQLFERGGQYVQELTDVFSNTLPEIARLNSQRMNTVMELMAEQAQQQASAKAKSEGMANLNELMRSNIFNPVAAYENMFKMTREMFDSSLKSISPTGMDKAVARTASEAKKAA